MNKIWSLILPVEVHVNLKGCITTEHNNFLIVSFKVIALLDQTAANLLKDAISDSIPTSCSNQHLLRLTYLVRMIEVVRKAKSVK